MVDEGRNQLARELRLSIRRQITIAVVIEGSTVSQEDVSRRRKQNHAIVTSPSRLGEKRLKMSRIEGVIGVKKLHIRRSGEDKPRVAGLPLSRILPVPKHCRWHAGHLRCPLNR